MATEKQKANGKSPFVIVMAFAVAILVCGWGYRLYKGGAPTQWWNSLFATNAPAKVVISEPTRAHTAITEKVCITPEWRGVEVPNGMSIYIDKPSGVDVEIRKNYDQTWILGRDYVDLGTDTRVLEWRTPLGGRSGVTTYKIYPTK
jgi:hypothetical protein